MTPEHGSKSEQNNVLRVPAIRWAKLTVHKMTGPVIAMSSWFEPHLIIQCADTTTHTHAETESSLLLHCWYDPGTSHECLINSR